MRPVSAEPGARSVTKGKPQQNAWGGTGEPPDASKLQAVNAVDMRLVAPKPGRSDAMKPRSRTCVLITMTLGAVVPLLALTASAAGAAPTVPQGRVARAQPVANAPVYAANIRVLSANGISWFGVDCPAGTLPAGGGTAVQSPLVEHVVQAGFAVSPETGKVDGYQASVQVSGLAKGASVRFAVQVACLPSVATFVSYAVHTQVLSANGTTWWSVPCPAGALPVGGGTAVQNPLIEHAAQAGFVASAATGKVNGYRASVQVSGLAKGANVRFAVQVACLPLAIAPVFYPVYTRMLSANGSSLFGVDCPAGTLPVGGGTAVQNPLIERVAQAGFAASTATGRVDSYQANVQVGGLARGTSVRFGVQVACIPAATPPVYGPPTKARPASVVAVQAMNTAIATNWHVAAAHTKT